MNKNAIREKRINNASKFGRADSDGRVFLQLGPAITDGEKFVGQDLTGETNEAMSRYVNRFVDLEEKIDLFEERLKSDINVTSPTIDKTINSFKLFYETKNAIGDYSALQKRIEDIQKLGEETKVINAQRRKELIESAMAELASITLAVEAQIKEDVSKIIWKNAIAAYEKNFERWKEIRRTVKLPEKYERECKELWERLESARNTIYKGRNEFNNKFRKITDDVKAKKNILIEEAEKLKDHEDLEYARKEFANLMNRWKKITQEVGHGRKIADEKQWATFKSIQDYFYSRLPKQDPEAEKRRNDNQGDISKWKKTEKISSNIGERLGSSFDDLMALKAQLEK